MSIFRRDSETPSTSAAPQPSRPLSSGKVAPNPSGETTHIAAGSKFTGVISGATEVLVDGEVDGEIRIGSRAVIGPKGSVEGQVEARSVQLSGRVTGNVKASERVEILASGRLEGDVSAKRVSMAEGAVVNGKVQMTLETSGGEKKVAAPVVHSPPSRAAK